MSAAASDGVGFCGGVVALLAGLLPLRLGPGKRRRDHPGGYLNPGWPPSGILRVRRPLPPAHSAVTLPPSRFSGMIRVLAWGKGAIPMRSDTSRLPLVLAGLVGGLALMVLPVAAVTGVFADMGPLVEIRGDWRFDEGSGTTAHDSSSYGNDGEVHSA